MPAVMQWARHTPLCWCFPSQIGLKEVTAQQHKWRLRGGALMETSLAAVPQVLPYNTVKCRLGRFWILHN